MKSKNISKTKLIVFMIDMQDFFLKNLTPENRKRIILGQGETLDFCAKNKISLIVFEYADRGQTINILSKKFNKVSEIKIIKKENNSGFTDTNLAQVLKDSGTRKILLMGINASGCVQDTAISALHRGYKIITSRSVIASSSKRDRNLNTSKKWYSKNGLFFEDNEKLLKYLKKTL
jgi:isochorismate hydrolase